MPISSNALNKAQSRLRSASKAIDDLKSAESHEQFSDIWFTFLFAWKSVYTVLQQATKVTPKIAQWYSSKETERKDDPLLQYLYEARNVDEHGLEAVTKEKPGSIGVKPVENTGVFYNGVFGFKDGKFMVPAATDRHGNPVDLNVTINPSRTILVPVVARGNRTYNPPQEHLGQRLIDSSPIGIAEVSVAYLKMLLQEAAALP